MRFMLWQGQDDPIFPGAQTQTSYRNILNILGASSTIIIDENIAGQGHDLTQNEFAAMNSFIRNEAWINTNTFAVANIAKVPLLVISIAFFAF